MLPIDFKPTGKDIICGRARENFYHDGNCYFRKLVKKYVGPYLAARKKIEKRRVILIIIDNVKQNSPLGGFVKRDTISGRWYRISDEEAREKVAHAVREAAQQVEEAKPKLAARLKKESRPFPCIPAATSSTKQSRHREDTCTEPIGCRDANVGFGATKPPDESIIIESQRMKEYSALEMHHHSRRAEDGERKGNNGIKANPRCLEYILGASKPTLSDSINLAPTTLLRGRSATSSAPLQANMFYNFQSNLDILLLMESARQVELNRLPPLFRPSENQLRSSDAKKHGTPAAELFWLSAALHQQREDARRLMELEYARELTMSTLAARIASTASFYTLRLDQNLKLGEKDDEDAPSGWV